MLAEESKFHLRVRANHPSCVYYSNENSHVVLEKDFKVLGRIIDLFLQENVTGDVYLNLLQEKIMSAILKHCPLDVVLQQDGAPPHYAVQVRQFFDEHLRQSWIEPARACDLTSMEDIETLKVFTEAALQTFTP